MEKNTLGTFLWLSITVIVMLTLVAFASPFGTYVRDNIDTFTGNYVEDNVEQAPQDVAFHTVTVKYSLPPDANINISDIQQTLKEGESYKIISPEINGYVPDKKIVEGVVTEETEINVIYTYGQYEIKFVTNNGDWATNYAPPSSYIYKTSTRLPCSTEISRPHYTFAGWYYDEALTQEARNISEIDYGDKVFYAKWVATLYNISFDLNDRESNGYYYHPDTELAKFDSELDLSKYATFKYGEQVKLPETVHKFGYTFKGWSLERDGQDKSKWRTQITESDSGSIVLYAQYERNTYNIHYDLKFTSTYGEEREFQIISDNYQIRDMITGKTTTLPGYPKTYTYGDVITLPTVQLEGYDQYTEYEIWFNKDTNNISVTGSGKLPNDNLVSGYPADMVQKTEISPATIGFVTDTIEGNGKFDYTNIYLHVKPIPNNYYVAFNINAPKTARTNSNTQMQNQIFTYDYKTKLSNNTYKFTGYTFDGWNTKSDGSGKRFTNQELVNGTDVYKYIEDDGTVLTLYAQWKKNDVNVKYVYYFQDIATNTYIADTTKTQTVKYKADSTASFSSYVKEYTGFTLNSTKYYDPLASTPEILATTHATNNKLTTNNFYVMPDGTTEIRFYYKRKTYTLNFSVVSDSTSQGYTAQEVFKTATGTSQQGYMSGISINASNAYSASKTVKYNEKIDFTVTHDSPLFIVSYWNADTSPTTESNAGKTTYTYTVPNIESGTVNITVHIKLNQGKITFKANYSGSPAPSWTTDQEKYFTYGLAYSNTGFPTISRNCYQFDGWTDANGNYVSESDTFTTSSATTLYAQWTRYPNSSTSKHDFKEESRTNPTCTGTGQINEKCSRCGIKKTTTIPAAGHDKGRTVDGPASTCTTKGYSTVNCTKCNHELSRTYKPLISHKYDAQCLTAHNTGHSSNVNISPHKCIGPDNTKVKICYSHIVCSMCGKQEGSKWCLTHGRWKDTVQHNVNCVTKCNSKHVCKGWGSESYSKKDNLSQDGC